MDAFTKIIHPANMFVYRHCRSPIFCKIQWKDGKLSIGGVVGPRKSGNAAGGCGQIDMGFAHRNPAHDDTRYDKPTTPEELTFADGWDADKWFLLLEVWKTYHLNEVNSACEHQRALGWTYETHQEQNCPACGYKIGTEWEKIKVPEWALEWLQALPDSDRKPAWV